MARAKGSVVAPPPIIRTSILPNRCAAWRAMAWRSRTLRRRRSDTAVSNCCVRNAPPWVRLSFPPSANSARSRRTVSAETRSVCANLCTRCVGVNNRVSRICSCRRDLRDCVAQGQTSLCDQIAVNLPEDALPRLKSPRIFEPLSSKSPGIVSHGSQPAEWAPGVHTLYRQSRQWFDSSCPASLLRLALACRMVLNPICRWQVAPARLCDNRLALPGQHPSNARREDGFSFSPGGQAQRAGVRDERPK